MAAPAAPSKAPAASTTAPPASSDTTAQKPAAALEEDDEFEDFPVEGAFLLSSMPRQSKARVDVCDVER